MLAKEYMVMDVNIAGNDIHISLDRIDEFYNDLTMIRTYREQRKDEIYGKNNNIYSDIRIPCFLSSYLRYSIQRRREYEYISRHSLHPVYQMLSKYKWMMQKSGENGYRIISSDITEMDAHMVMYFIGTSKVVHANVSHKGASMYIIDASLSILYRMDKYYHPVIPIY